MNNGYRFAELARGESLQSPDFCYCCGRQDLKKTVKLINPEGRVVWFGVGCAARAMSVKPLVVRQAKRTAEDRLADQEARERHALQVAENAVWQEFLNRAAGLIPSWDGRPNRCAQIERLGGYVAAREAYKADGGEIREEAARQAVAKTF